MPKTDNGKSKRKSSPRRVLKRGGKGGKDDDDSSVDSKGNIRGLIDYDYTSDSESETSVSTPSRPRSPRTPRKAAVAARKKIAKAVAKDEKREARQSPKPRETTKEQPKKNKIIYKRETKTKEVKRLTPSKRRYPFNDYKKPSVKRRSPSYSRSSEESAFPLRS